jgi:methylated-DNA-[protein]-cysteine S-methyltransferase
MYATTYNSPFGLILISASENGIFSVSFVKDFNNHDSNSKLTATCMKQLDEYFSGKRKIFDLPLDAQGTSFQQQVWTVLQQIPYGKIVSYLDIAKLLGDPGKIRAVGNANGKNPIAIIVPCHRVIGSDGSLTGYAGGLDKKRRLLQLEGAMPGELF